MIKGDAAFGSAPISRLHINTTWDNASGKKLNPRAQAVLNYGLKLADICNADPGIGSMFGGSVTYADENGSKTKGFDFGADRQTWLSKQFKDQLQVNCCRGATPDRDMGIGNIETKYDSQGKAIYPYWLCDKSNKINEETLVLQPKLTRLDEKGLEITMDVYLGAEKRLLGSVSCSVEEPTKPECIDAPVPDATLYTTEKDYTTGATIHPLICDLHYRATCIKKVIQKIAADFNR